MGIKRTGYIYSTSKDIFKFYFAFGATINFWVFLGCMNTHIYNAEMTKQKWLGSLLGTLINSVMIAIVYVLCNIADLTALGVILFVTYYLSVILICIISKIKTKKHSIKSKKYKSTTYEFFILDVEKEMNKIISGFQMRTNYLCVAKIKTYWMDFLYKAKYDYPEKYKNIVDNNANDPKRWALARISDRAFDIIASGEYHLQDVLTPEGEILASLYRYCLEEALRLKYIDKETLNKQLGELRRQIYETGLWA